MSKHPLLGTKTVWVLGLGLVLGAVVFILVVIERLEGDDRDELLRNMAGTAFTFVLVGLFAAGAQAVLKRSLDKRDADEKERRDDSIRAADKLERELTEERQRQAVLDQTRMDFLTRLVGVANLMRRAPILIEANRSAKTYSEQMRHIVDGGLELRLLGHELRVGGGAIVFHQGQAISDYLRTMQNYVGRLAKEFRESYQDVADLQRVIEAETNPKDQQRLRRELWGIIRGLDTTSELLVEDPLGLQEAESTPDADVPERTREGDMSELQLRGERSELYVQFFGPYEAALILMRAEILLGAGVEAPEGA